MLLGSVKSRPSFNLLTPVSEVPTRPVLMTSVSGQLDMTLGMPMDLSQLCSLIWEDPF